MQHKGTPQQSASYCKNLAFSFVRCAHVLCTQHGVKSETETTQEGWMTLKRDEYFFFTQSGTNSLIYEMDFCFCIPRL